MMLDGQTADPDQIIADLRRERDEALAREAALAEVLRVINSSPGNLAPVFEAILGKAMRLCEAAFGGLWIFEKDRYVAVALNGVPPAYAGFLARTTMTPGPGTAPYQFLHGHKGIVHNRDLAAEEPYRAGDPQRRALVDLGGARTALQVAMRKDDRLLGVITLYRQEVRPFSDKQVALFQNFAVQAVIAMDNARLLTETRESLEQQQAMAEVLRVINSSPGDLTPVFDAMLDKAMRLCDAAFGILLTRDGDLGRLVAQRQVPKPFLELLARTPVKLKTVLGPNFRDGPIVHVADLAAGAPYRDGIPLAVAAVDLGGIRSFLVVPLAKDGALIGIVAIYRQEVRPFTDKQIALLQNFAAQAVIAMENARLLTETREALERQTAIGEVLKVIGRSAVDLDAVLHTVVTSAIRLCHADHAVIYRYEGGQYRWAAGHSLPRDYERIERGVTISPGPGTLVGRAALERRAVQIADAWTDPLYEPKDDARVGGVHSMLGVPLLRDGAVLGVIGLARGRVEPYSEREVDLVTTFADQAVIAIENARLLTETRETLAQQQAIAEVLQVINSSPGDLQPVFEAILEKATRLCKAAFGILLTYDGVRFRHAALRGVPTDYADFMKRNPPLYGRGTGPARILDGERLVHVLDAMDTELYGSGDPNRRALVDLAGARSLLLVPLLKDDAVVGIITIYRQEVRSFTDKQIALLQNFAAQAVIAMDNARLLNEIRQRQAELRVTFENMGDGVAMFDSELRLAAWNHNFQQILDLDDAFVTSRPSFADYLRLLDERGELDRTGIEAETGHRLQDFNRELRFERTRPDGRVVEVRRNPVPGGGCVLIYSDVTERQRAEEAVRAARDAAEATLAELKTAQASLIHAQKMAALGQLTAGIAHEIKNPLNFVNNFAGLSVDLLAEMKGLAEPGFATLDDDARADIDEVIGLLSSNLEKIAEHGRRADGIVKSMLAHSRGSSGERQQVDLNALVEEALNLAYHGARAQDQEFNITLERDLAADIAPVELVPQDVMRVFLNLIGNGFHAAHQRRKADPAFRPILKVATRNLGRQVEVRVRDNGTGIPPAHRDKLFQPFFTTKPPGEGTGLGLSISYDIVTQQHGGSISVDSQEGVFTEFTVRLPRVVPGRARIGRAAGRAA
jgi:PAS domain S-box-containing protein